MKILIAGKIESETIYNCVNKFDKAEEKLKKKYPEAEIMNPLKIEGIKLGDDIFMYEDKLREVLEECDTLYLMGCWENSKYSRELYNLAKELKISIEGTKKTFDKDYLKDIKLAKDLLGEEKNLDEDKINSLLRRKYKLDFEYFRKLIKDYEEFRGKS